MFETPEEERIVVVVQTLNLDVSSVVVRQGEVHTRKRRRDLEVCARRGMSRETE